MIHFVYWGTHVNKRTHSNKYHVRKTSKISLNFLLDSIHVYFAVLQICCHLACNTLNKWSFESQYCVRFNIDREGQQNVWALEAYKCFSHTLLSNACRLFIGTSIYHLELKYFLIMDDFGSQVEKQRFVLIWNIQTNTIQEFADVCDDFQKFCKLMLEVCASLILRPFAYIPLFLVYLGMKLLLG